MERLIESWAKNHPQVKGVVLGGSRAKGNANEESDWDFGILLNESPSIGLVEELTADIGLEPKRAANVAPQLERAFIIVSKAFETDKGEVSLNFTDANELEEAFNHTNYTIIEHHLEFLTSAKVVYDPEGTLESIRTRLFPQWAREKLIRDALGLAEWNIDKHHKARSAVTRTLLKATAMWFVAKAIAAHNNILLTYRYGYDAFREQARTTPVFEAPEGFFDVLERTAGESTIEDLEDLLTRVKTLVEP